MEFHFPEPTELPPPLIQLIDVDFKYPGRCVLEGPRGVYHTAWTGRLVVVRWSDSAYGCSAARDLAAVRTSANRGGDVRYGDRRFRLPFTYGIHALLFRVVP